MIASRRSAYLVIDDHSIRLLRDPDYEADLKKIDLELVKTFKTRSHKPAMTVWVYAPKNLP